MRLAAFASLVLLAGCATASSVDPPTALNGRELDTALNLYGRWDERILLDGQPQYVWRRAVLMNGNTYYCELRSEVGYRNTISRVVVEGYPAACSLFQVQYKSGYDVNAKPDAPAAPDAEVASAVKARNFRPVGAQAAASVSQSAEDAAAHPPEAAADRGGS